MKENKYLTMEKIAKTKFYRLILLSFSILVVYACSEEEGGKGYNGAEVEQSLSVTINFDSINQPSVGNKLDLNLYYSDISGKSRLAMIPDFSFHYALSRDQIDNGFTVSFNSFEKKEEIYAGVHIDTDQDGALNSGDFAVFYNDKSLEDVEDGTEKPNNVANEEAITIVVDRMIEELVAEEIVDYDGNEYKTVVIGDQVWFAENLKVTHYNNGDPIPTGLDDSEWADTTLGAYTIFPHQDIDGLNSDQDVVDKYGLLYNWSTIDNPKGICPEGWKVPLDTDWKILERTIGMSEDESNDAGWRGEMAPRLMSTDGWIENVGEDKFGFRALPLGTRLFNGSKYYRNGSHAYFWTASPSGSNADAGIRRLLTYNNLGINRSSRPSTEGMCIRCIMIN